jgi:hypothetical protein
MRNRNNAILKKNELSKKYYNCKYKKLCIPRKINIDNILNIIIFKSRKAL